MTSIKTYISFHPHPAPRNRSYFWWTTFWTSFPAINAQKSPLNSLYIMILHPGHNMSIMQIQLRPCFCCPQFIKLKINLGINSTSAIDNRITQGMKFITPSLNFPSSIGNRAFLISKIIPGYQGVTGPIGTNTWVKEPCHLILRLK